MTKEVASPEKKKAKVAKSLEKVPNGNNLHEEGIALRDVLNYKLLEEEPQRDDTGVYLATTDNGAQKLIERFLGCVQTEPLFIAIAVADPSNQLKAI